MPQLETHINQEHHDAYGQETLQTAIPVETPEVLIQDYQFIRLIGEGANGKTWLAISRQNQKKVAIKALKLVDAFKSLELFKREAQTLLNLNVRGVPKFYEFVESENAMDECYLVQEFFDYPSIQTLIDENNAHKTKFSEAETLHIMKEVAQILYALQTQYTPPVIHRDIKPSNILYDRLAHRAMLIDFGAVATPSKKSGGSTVAGTQGFMAPEQMLGECTIQSDFYGLGATALYMLTGVSPVNMSYDKANPFLLKFDEVFKGIKLSSRMKDFLKSLLSPQAENRPANAFELLDTIKQLDPHNQSKLKRFQRFFAKKEDNNARRRIIRIRYIDKSALEELPKFLFIYVWVSFFIISAIASEANDDRIVIFAIIGCILFAFIFSGVFVYINCCSKKITLRRGKQRHLPCVNGYEPDKVVIERYRFDEARSALCVYYCAVDKRYKIYQYQNSEDIKNFQNSKTLGILKINDTTRNLVDGTKRFQRKA